MNPSMMNMNRYMVIDGKPFQGWIATLDNGETVMETPPVPGEPMAWRKLIRRCKEDALRITSLRLQLHNSSYMAMPHKACDGYFQAFEVRKQLFDTEAPEELFRGIGSVVYDRVYITWVKMVQDPSGMVYSYQDVRSLESSRIHTTLSE